MDVSRNARGHGVSARKMGFPGVGSHRPSSAGPNCIPTIILGCEYSETPKRDEDDAGLGSSP